MNERLKEIAHQADLVIKKRNGDDFRFGGMDPKLEKFAELIVKAVFDRIADERFEVYEPVVKSVKQHFGVEE